MSTRSSLTTSPVASNEPVGQAFVFEVAWEIVNKVGGIYTVLKTKAAETVAELGADYCMIGPYVEATAKLECEVQELPPGPLERAVRAMRAGGVKITYGRWLIDGAPRVLLFDVGAAMSRADEWKRDFHSKVKIGCPWDDNESTSTIVFGYLVAWFLGEFAHQTGGARIIAQFHEWLAGVGLVLSRVRALPIATVFTTHATLLGRYLCADESTDFYRNLPFFDVDFEAGRRGIYHRYCLERAATHSAHVFTTVSQITADEAEHLLKRKVDVITPNGLNAFKFAALHEFQNMHAKGKDKITKFVQGHFYGHMDFDLDNTLYFFLAGRYEFRNKGADMFLEALARLNHLLKVSKSDKTIVAFLIMPAKTHNYAVETLRGQATNKLLIDTVAELQSKIGKQMYDAVSAGKLPTDKSLLDADDLIKLKRCLFAIQHPTLPPVVTHNLVDEQSDPVLSTLRRLRLFNERSDRVKVVFHPEFLNPSSPLLPMEYDDFVRGCHLGVFPSYYEPWGYTPAECTVMGVPSVTSNLSGFGCFIEEQVEAHTSYGLYVVDRRFKSPDESVQQLTEYMFDYCQLNRRQRVNLRNRTERLSEVLGWRSLQAAYTSARKWAFDRAFGDQRDAAGKAESSERFKQRASACNSPKPPRLHLASLSEDGPPEDQFQLDKS